MSLFTRSLEKRNRKYLKDVKLQDLNNQYQKAQNDIIRELDLGLISRAETKNKLEEMQNTLREQSGATVLAKQANEIIEPQKEEYKPMTASDYENILRNKRISPTERELNYPEIVIDKYTPNNVIYDLKEIVINSGGLPSNVKEELEQKFNKLLKTKPKGEVRIKLPAEIIEQIKKSKSSLNQTLSSKGNLLNELTPEKIREIKNTKLKRVPPLQNKLKRISPFQQELTKKIEEMAKLKKTTPDLIELEKSIKSRNTPTTDEQLKKHLEKLNKKYNLDLTKEEAFKLTHPQRPFKEELINKQISNNLPTSSSQATTASTTSIFDEMPKQEYNKHIAKHSSEFRKEYMVKTGTNYPKKGSISYEEMKTTRALWGQGLRKKKRRSKLFK